MTKLYALDLRYYENGAWRDLLPKLPPERRQRALACRFEPDKMRIVCAGYLLQLALEHAGIPVASQIFAENQWGKPYLKHHNDIHFSLSHSGIWAVCAVSDENVGVDVELPRCSMAMAKRLFRKEELEGLEALDRYHQADALNRLWTAKEAFLKMLGKGLTLPLNSFTVRLDRTAVLEQSYTTLPYRLHEYRQGLYRICLCTTAPRPELQLLEPH